MEAARLRDAVFGKSLPLHHLKRKRLRRPLPDLEVKGLRHAEETTGPRPHWTSLKAIIPSTSL